MKKIFSLFLGLVMVFALLPMTAFADEYGISVRGVPVTDANAADVLGDGGTVKYDHSTNTLTLDGAQINPAEGTNPIEASGDINIEVNGNVSMASIGGYGITANSVSISGSGNISISKPNFGIYGATGVTVSDSVSLTIESAMQGILTHGDVAINSSGDVSITADTFGILADGNVTISGSGNMTITAAIYAIDAGAGAVVTIADGLEIEEPAGAIVKNAIFESDGTTPAKQVKIAPHEHSGTLNAGNPATCTTDGVKDYYTCSSCGKAFEDENCTTEIANLDTWMAEGAVIKALGHSFTSYVSNNDATCGADGTKTAKCDRCDATDTVTDEGTATGVHQDENNDGICDVCKAKVQTNPDDNTQGGTGTTPPPADDENQGGNTNPGDDVTPPTDGGNEGEGTNPPAGGNDNEGTKPEETTKPEAKPEEKPAETPATPAPAPVAPAPRYTSPNTGDNTASLAMLALVSGIALCGTAIKKRK